MPKNVHHRSFSPGFDRLLALLGTREALMLVTLTGASLGIWAFAELSLEIGKGDSRAFDEAVLMAMRRPGDLAPVGPSFIQEAARDLTALGGITVLSLLTLSISGFMVFDGKRRMALFTCGAIASGGLLVTILKLAFNRPRPDLVPHLVSVSTSSFPSGHSMMAAMTYLTLGALVARAQNRKILKAYSILSAALPAFLVGLSRVYLGVHWPTDVLAGWAAGSSWALFTALLACALQNRGTLESESKDT